MRHPRILLVWSIAAVLYLSPTLAAKPEGIMPEFDKMSGELVLLPERAYTTKAWRINNWKKKQEAAISYPADRTPTGAPTLKIDFTTDGGGCNIVGPALATKGPWTMRRYGVVTLWVKGDNGGKQASFAVSAASDNYSWRIALDSAKWRKVRLPVERAFTRKGTRKDLHTAKLCYVSCGLSASFLIGDIRFEPSAQETASDLSRAIVIPQFAGKITLDGKLNEPAWNRALKIDTLNVAKTALPPRETTEVRMFSDGVTLYVAGRLADADTSKLKAAQTQRDTQVWQDDCIEIFIDHNLDARTYNHVVMNSVGTVQDYRKRFSQAAETYIIDKDWNPGWSHSSRIEPRRWTVEIALPLSEFGIKPGEAFGLQIGRENHTGREYSALTKTERFTNVRRYAVCAIAPQSVAIGKPVLMSKSPGDMLITGRLPSAAELELAFYIADPYGSLQQEKARIATDKAGHFKLPVLIKTPVEGDYRVVVSGTANGRTLAPLGLIFNMVLPADIEYGDIFLNPKPKEMTLTDGRFQFDGNVPIVLPPDASARAMKTARFLRAEAHWNLLGLYPAITRTPTEGKTFRLSLGGAASKLPSEGYSLTVTPDGVTLTGADEAGLYYGVVTFTQLLRISLTKKHEAAVGCARIVDWPDMKVRLLQMWLGSHRRYKEPRNDPAVLKQYLKTYVAGNKFNHWSPMLDHTFDFSRESRITSPKGMLSWEDYRELVAFAREHFIEVIPAFQSGGHSGHITKAHRDLQEPGYNHDQVNVLHPKFYDILFSCYDDILAAVPDAKYFHIWHDEWWHRPTAAIKDSFQGKKRWEILLGDLLKNHTYFKKRGIRMMMCCDMLLREHNGGYPFFLSKALEQLPRDIIMMNWSVNSAPNGTRELAKLGFPVMQVVNQVKLIPPKDLPLLAGYGTVQYGHFRQSFWYSRDHVLPGYLHAPFRAADYSWNAKVDGQLPLPEWRRKYMNNVNALYNMSNRRAAGLRFEPVDLGPVANARTTEWFGKPELAPAVPRGVNAFGFVPFRVADRKGADIVAATAAQPEIPIDIKPSVVKMISFLQASYLPKEQRDAFKKRSAQYLYGVPLGEIRIEYEDGPSALVELRMGVNTLEVTPVPSARFMHETRYTHDVKTAGGRLASLYVIEWANPYHRRRVKRIIWKGYGLEATPVLFGMTLAH